MRNGKCIYNAYNKIVIRTIKQFFISFPILFNFHLFDISAGFLLLLWHNLMYAYSLCCEWVATNVSVLLQAMIVDSFSEQVKINAFLCILEKAISVFEFFKWGINFFSQQGIKLIPMIFKTHNFHAIHSSLNICLGSFAVHFIVLSLQKR